MEEKYRKILALDKLISSNTHMIKLVDRLSIQDCAHYTTNNPEGTFNVRGVFRHDKGGLSLEGKQSRFSIIAHNLGLLVAPAPYLGTDRDGAITEVIQRIKDIKPDVVGLCEVFANGEREKIIAELSDYKHFREGPDKGDPLSDGGLLILSKHPILKDSKILYIVKVWLLTAWPTRVFYISRFIQ